MNPNQHLRTAFFLPLGLLAMSGASSLFAQEGHAGVKKPDSSTTATAMDFTTTSRMIGATVFLKAGAQAVAEARSEGDTAKRPTATVDEWLVDSRSGELCNAVVSFGGFLGIGDKTVLVPAKELSWNNSMERYDLAWTIDQLKAKPAFDLDKACKTGLDAACGFDAGADKSHDKKATDASTRKAIHGTEFVHPTCCLAKASSIAKSPVYASSKEWGKVSDLIVDRKQNTIVLAIVNHGSTLGVGGDNYLVPIKYLTTCQKADDDNTPVLCAVTRTAADLQNCVPFEKPKNGVVDVEAAKRALAGKTGAQ